MIKKHYLRSCAILLIAMLVAFASCSHKHQYPVVLTAIDSLCESRPDSAQALLKSIETDTANMAEDARMYYKLLTIRNADKLYLLHTNDSLILRLVDYYEKGGDAQLLPIAYYYAGRIYRDLNKTPQALAFFQKAIDADNAPMFLHTKSKAYSQTGSILANQRLKSEARNAYEKAYLDDVQRKDTLGQIFNLRDIAFCLSRTAPDSMPLYFNKALRLARLIHREDMVNSINTQLADFYIGHIKDAKKALPYIRKSIEFDDPKERMATSVIAAKIYQQLGKYDSVKIHSSRLLLMANEAAKQEGAHGMSVYYEHYGNADSLFKYSTMYRSLSDSVMQKKAEYAIAQMNAMYNYEKQEKRILALQHKNKINNYLLIGTFLLLCVVLSLAVMGINAVKSKNEIMKLKIERYETRYKEKALATYNEKTNKKESTKEVQKKEGYIHFKNIVNTNAVIRLDTIKEEDWMALEETILHEYPDFKNEVHSLCAMSDRDYHLCLLLKAGFQTAETTKLLRITSNNLYSICRKLSKRAFGSEKSFSEWRNIIQSL